ncbi:hypothetical protein V1512DRAFT_256934 [Lipomyces arxii]|uniref:uncharacterized protein n=1 Tax=Lipomyces arxii TaxID=56418 RepID=UPI0034D01BC7
MALRVYIMLAMLVLIMVVVEATENVHIGITKKVPKEDCLRKSKKGDLIYVHYTGFLEDGYKFDTSLDKGSPLRFTLGRGQVIQGWDRGLLGMCIGEHRKLTVPASLGYGDRDMGDIPAGSTLIFETELVSIGGYTPPPRKPQPAAPETIPEPVQAEQIELETPIKTAESAVTSSQVIDPTPEPESSSLPSSESEEQMFTILPIDTDAEPETLDRYKRDEL